MTVTREDARALTGCRAAAHDLARLLDERRSMTALRAPRLDGMPRKKAPPGGLEGPVARLMDLDRDIRQAQARRLTAERAAREALMRMEPTPGMYRFCLWYYIHGSGLKQAQIEAQISRTQAWRHKERIQKAASE